MSDAPQDACPHSVPAPADSEHLAVESSDEPKVSVHRRPLWYSRIEQLMHRHVLPMAVRGWNWIVDHHRECAAMVIVVMMAGTFRWPFLMNRTRPALPEGEFTDVDSFFEDFGDAAGDKASGQPDRLNPADSSTDRATGNGDASGHPASTLAFEHSSLTRIIPDGAETADPPARAVIRISRTESAEQPAHAAHAVASGTASDGDSEAAAVPAFGAPVVQPAEKTPAVHSIRFRGLINPVPGSAP